MGEIAEQIVDQWLDQMFNEGYSPDTNRAKSKPKKRRTRNLEDLEKEMTEEQKSNDYDVVTMMQLEAKKVVLVDVTFVHPDEWEIAGRPYRQFTKSLYAYKMMASAADVETFKKRAVVLSKGTDQMTVGYLVGVHCGDAIDRVPHFQWVLHVLPDTVFEPVAFDKELRQNIRRGEAVQKARTAMEEARRLAGLADDTPVVPCIESP